MGPKIKHTSHTYTHTHTEFTELAQKQAAAGRTVLTLKSALELRRGLRQSTEGKVTGSIPVMCLRAQPHLGRSPEAGGD